MTYTFMPGHCRRVLQGLHRRAGLPGGESFDRSVNFFPDSVAWLIQFGFISRRTDGELVLTERGMDERVFFADDDTTDYVATAEVVPADRVPAALLSANDTMIGPGEIWTCSVQSLQAPFLDPNGLFFGSILGSLLPDLKICSIAIGDDRERIFAEPEPSADEVSRMVHIGTVTLRRILPGEKIHVRMRNDGTAPVPVRVQLCGTTALFRDTW